MSAEEGGSNQAVKNGLWGKAREATINHIGTAIGVFIGTAFLSGAIVTWAALKAWLIVEIPAGVVVASTVTCRDLKGGWTNYGPAGGRFIIGAGQHNNFGVTKIYDPFIKEGIMPPTKFESSTGGRERIKLTDYELPVHGHSISTRGMFDPHDGLTAGPSIGQNKSGIDETFDENAPKAEGYGELKNVISTAGKGNPFEIMPPYVALYYCNKQ